MKKVAYCIAVFLLSASLAGASLLLSDSFSYPDGPLVTVSSNVWAHHSGSVTGEVAVVSGRVLLNEANTYVIAACCDPVNGFTVVYGTIAELKVLLGIS